MRPRLPETTLRYMIGHKSAQMTDHYTHYAIEDKLREYLLPVQSDINSAWDQN